MIKMLELNETNASDIIAILRDKADKIMITFDAITAYNKKMYIYNDNNNNIGIKIVNDNDWFDTNNEIINLHIDVNKFTDEFLAIFREHISKILRCLK